MSTLHPYDGPRGLHGFTKFPDTYGVEVALQESSALAMVDDAGAITQIVHTGSPEYCWLRISGEQENGDAMYASAHLSRENARELRDALDAFLIAILAHGGRAKKSTYYERTYEEGFSDGVAAALADEHERNDE